MEKVRKISMATVTILLLLTIVTIEPVYAWASLTHEAIIKGVNIPIYGSYARGGAIGTDMFDFLPDKAYYSDLVHTVRPADFSRELLHLSKNDGERSYSYGSLAHASSDIIGHTQYINPIAGTNTELSTLIEIGVDSNVEKKLDSISFSIPYKLVQNAYKNIYDTSPGYWDIYYASKNMMMAIYLEKYLIDNGILDNLKNQVINYQDAYDKSISYSSDVIKDPSKLENLNLITGLPALSNTNTQTNNVANVNKEMSNIVDELNKENIVTVDIKDDKQNKVFHVGDIQIKDKKKFEEIMNKFKKPKR